MCMCMPVLCDGAPALTDNLTKTLQYCRFASSTTASPVISLASVEPLASVGPLAGCERASCALGWCERASSHSFSVGARTLVCRKRSPSPVLPPACTACGIGAMLPAACCLLPACAACDIGAAGIAGAPK